MSFCSRFHYHQNGELSLTLEQSASLMNKGSHTLQMADKAIEIARSERQKMNAFWYPSLNASGAYVHLSNNIEVKEPLKQFTDPAKDFVHSIVPDDKFISSILDNIGAHTLTFPLLERNLTTIDANVMWPLFTGGKRIFATRIGNRMVDLAKAGREEAGATLQSEPGGNLLCFASGAKSGGCTRANLSRLTETLP